MIIQQQSVNDIPLKRVPFPGRMKTQAPVSLGKCTEIPTLKGVLCTYLKADVLAQASISVLIFSAPFHTYLCRNPEMRLY